jgi:hypothetical protein
MNRNLFWFSGQSNQSNTRNVSNVSIQNNKKESQNVGNITRNSNSELNAEENQLKKINQLSQKLKMMEEEPILENNKIVKHTNTISKKGIKIIKKRKTDIDYQKKMNIRLKSIFASLEKLQKNKKEMKKEMKKKKNSVGIEKKTMMEKLKQCENEKKYLQKKLNEIIDRLKKIF